MILKRILLAGGECLRHTCMPCKIKSKVKVIVIKSDKSKIKRLKKNVVKFQALADKIWIRNCMINFYRKLLHPTES